mmetsp:Transcript_39816/g.88514  ORF Transcript_39816/g.88514 Transcript_39816/m.88514 type:complete len:333 (-) Transcript_39816:1185-2183(-)
MADHPRPTQTDKDRRVIRANYRNLQTTVVQDKAKLSAADGASELQRLLEKANELHKNVEKPREHAEDAKVMVGLTELGFESAKQLAQKQTGRSVMDFIRALRTNYVHTTDPQYDGMEDPGAFSWHELGTHAAEYFRPAPGVSCMLGPMDAQPKVRKVAQRQAKRPLGEVVRPQELDSIVEENKQETDRHMEEMFEILTELKQVAVSDLVCNHKSFGQTVENLFTLSFLVRDQRVYLYHDAALGLMVQVVLSKKDAPVQPNRRPDEQSQFIISLTMADWQEMCRIVRPQDIKMKHRDDSAFLEGAAAGRQRDEAGPSRAAGPSQGFKRRKSAT